MTVNQKNPAWSVSSACHTRDQDHLIRTTISRQAHKPLPRKFRGGIALLSIAFLALLSASPALAEETHPFLGPLGGSISPDTFTTPNGIAVDESTGDVYVADLGTSTVYRFDANGAPVNFSSLGSNALTGIATPDKSFMFAEASGNPAAIAVDNSTNSSDPSAGDLYVMDGGHDAVDKFSSSGTYLGRIAGPSVGVPFSRELFGLGVDTSGDVRVEVQEVGVEVFDDSAANGFMERLEGNGGGPPLHFREPSIHGFAVGDSPDSAYELFSCGCVSKSGPHEEWLGRVDNGTMGVAVAVDRANGHLYIDEQSSVGEWDTGQVSKESDGFVAPHGETPLGSLVSSFGSLPTNSSGQGGIAVNGTSGDIYVSSPADGKVYVFASTTPATTAGVPSNVGKTSATLQGSVDPRGVPVGSCVFEYEAKPFVEDELSVPVVNFGHSVPCATEDGQPIGAGTAPVNVHAEISGLEPGSLYHFRLVAGNANGTSPSSGLFATETAGFGMKEFEAAFLNKDGTPDTQAGSHPYEFVVDAQSNVNVFRSPYSDSLLYRALPEGTPKDFIFHFPPGFYGDINATTRKCPLGMLEIEFLGSHEFGSECPAASVVGNLEAEHLTLSGCCGEPIDSAVYSMAPPPGVAFQLGAQFIIPNLFIDVGLPAGGDSGLTATVSGLQVTAPVFSFRQTLFGGPPLGSNRPLLTMPSSCNGPLTSTMSADSYQDPGHFVSATSVTRNAAGTPAGMSGCAQLKFPPSIAVSPDVPDASTSSGITVGVNVSQKAALNPEGLAESGVRDLTVTLPEGVAINPAGADGLEACSADPNALVAGALGSPGDQIGYRGFEEFNPSSEPGDRTATFSPELPDPLLSGANFCPNGSKIGTVKVKTPLLEHELEGSVYLAAQDANPFGSLIAMYLVAEDKVSGTLIKLAGEVNLTRTGQIVTTFRNMPDAPFEEAELHFFGGERAPLTTPSRCGTYTTKAVFTPWDGNAPVETSSSFQIEHGPNGAPCPGASLPFNPSLTAGTTSNQAGGFSPFTMTMSRTDGEQNLQAISLHMPPGLSGLLTGVELCPEPQASQGLCGANSLIGETIVSVGVGGKPFSVKGGKVYITGPYGGAPFGLSIVNPAKAGSYDLEKGTPCDCVLVRAKIEVDPITSALTITSDNTGPLKIPTILDGIPLEIQHVNVTINRPGFTFNPTNCNSLGITGALDSTEGAVSNVSVPLQATNCAALGFAPKFAALTSGKTSREDGASLSVKLTYPSAPFNSQANIRQVKVELPKGLPSRLTTLQKACTAAQFHTNPAGCPAASVVGYAKAVTPLVPVPLEGPAYFVSNGGEAFPNLIVVLQGYGVTIDLVGDTFISKAGITSSTFKTVPDAPVGSFELTLPERPFSALTADGNLCKQKLAMPTEFLAQNGAQMHQTTKIAVTGCPKQTHHRKKRHHKTKHKTKR